MNRKKGSPEWRQFIQKSIAGGFEVITRIGDPVILHKKDTPISSATIWFVFPARKSGKWSKGQLKGMEILKSLGLHIFKYQSEIGDKHEQKSIS